MQPPEWKGNSPQRFSGGRKHVNMADQLNYALTSSMIPQSKGIRIFQSKPTPQAEFKPCLKVYEDSYHLLQKEIDLRGKKYLELPTQNQRVRKEKGHVNGGLETNAESHPKGIKTYQQANQSRNKQYSLELRMQQKIKILGLEDQRNGLRVTSMGDKIYKYPEYASNFYHSGGLIPGSTAFNKNGFSSQNHPFQSATHKSAFTKPMWSVKVKLDEKQQERTAINSVDEWEQTILKEANPKWNDPDTFFERMEKNNVPSKDVKKAGKK